jgi:hypothetical protein
MDMSQHVLAVFRGLFDQLKAMKQQQWTIANYGVLLIATTFAPAPVYLSCSGMTTDHSSNQTTPDTFKDVVAVTIDMSGNKITVDGELYQIADVSDQAIVVVAKRNDKDVVINLNRLSGKINLSSTTQQSNGNTLLHNFDGVCKRTNKLF